MPKVYSPISQDFYQEKYVKAQRKCVAEINTSNGGCRREEKSRKQWSLFTMLVTEIFFY